MAKTTGTAGKDAASAELNSDLLQFIVERHDQLWTRITERDDALHNQVLGIVSKIVDANSLDRVLATGLQEIADQIEEQMSPLREIPNSHKRLEDPDDARLTALNLALERPDFSLPGATEVGPLLGVPTPDFEAGSYRS